MEIKGFETIGYRLYIFKNDELYDTMQFETLQFDCCEDLVNEYSWYKAHGYKVSAERIERIIIGAAEGEV